MSTPRFHVPCEIPDSGLFELPGSAAHHASRVLRLSAGDELVIFDGGGGAFRCRMTGESPVVEILERRPEGKEAKIPVTLVQALCANDKMDWVVQKAVELGAAAIQVVETRRSVVRLSGDRARRREAHWRSVAISACEQCGRNVVPEIPRIEPLFDWIASQDGGGLGLMLSPSGAPLRNFPLPQGGVSLLVGPEGGFTPEEEAFAQSRGFREAKLGPAILRTETAGLAGLAAIEALWGE